MRILPYTVADGFTDTPLQGGQLAVFTDPGDLTSDEMHALTREMKLPESVFVLPASADGDLRIRIFTPAQELPFAGHPVLGAAVVLSERRTSDLIRLETGLGTIPVGFVERAGRWSSGG